MTDTPEIAEQSQSTADDKCVLIVDDNPVNRLVLKGIVDLFHDGKVAFAVDGLQAVEQFQKVKADFIFMDISMPNLDGLGATKAIRSFEVENDLDHTPIVAVTAHVSKEDREKCLKAGMDDHLPKPVNMDIIRDALSQYLLSNAA